jgi:hypothetical protein
MEATVSNTLCVTDASRESARCSLLMTRSDRELTSI